MIDTFDRNLAVAEKMFSKEQLQGYSTGYTSLDAYVRGVKPGSLTVLAGSTGIGKSLFALNVLVSLGKREIPTEYIDLENGEIISKQRLITIWGGKTPAFFEDHLNLGEAVATLEVLSEYISYQDKETLGSGNLFSSLLLRLNVTQAKVILIDPLQTLESETDSTSSFNEQGKIVRELKEFAQRHGKAIILCHHLRKGQTRGEWVTDREDVKEHRYQIPTIEDLKGSGKIADYATDVWGIMRTASSPTKEGRGKTLIRVLKNRTGLKGDIKMFFDEDTLRFFEEQKIYETSEVINFFEGGL